MTTPTPPDSGRLAAQAVAIFAEMIRPILREEIRDAVARALAERESRDEAAVYLDTAAAAKLALCSTKHLERLARAGTVKSYRAGRHLRFKAEDVAAYLEGAKP